MTSWDKAKFGPTHVNFMGRDINSISMFIYFLLVSLLVMCRQVTHKICGEHSTEYSSGQPQCSAHGQRLREHCLRFPYRSILHCWMIAIQYELTGTYPIYSGMSRSFTKHKTLNTRHPLALCGCMFLLMKANFENSWAPHPGFEPRPSAQQAGNLTTKPLSCLVSHMMMLIRNECDIHFVICKFRFCRKILKS